MPGQDGRSRAWNFTRGSERRVLKAKPRVCVQRLDRFWNVPSRKIVCRLLNSSLRPSNAICRSIQRKRQLEILIAKGELSFMKIGNISALHENARHVANIIHDGLIDEVQEGRTGGFVA